MRGCLEDSAIVKDHLFLRMKEDLTDSLLSILDGIGRFIDISNINMFIDPIVRAFLHTKNASLKNNIKLFIAKEYATTPSKVDAITLKRLEEWITVYKQNGQHEHMKAVVLISNQIVELGESDPFADE